MLFSTAATVMLVSTDTDVLATRHDGWVGSNDIKVEHSQENGWPGYVQSKKASGDFVDESLTAKDKVSAQLFGFLGLDDDWDGYGAQKPANKAVYDALEYLNLIPKGIPMPVSMASSDGEIGLFWEQQGYYIDVGFYGDDTYSFYAENPSGSSLSDDDQKVNLLII